MDGCDSPGRPRRTSVAHVLRFLKIAMAVFVGLLFAAGLECLVMWACGMRYTPPATVLRASVCDLSVSHDGRCAVTVERRIRQAARSKFEHVLIVHDLQNQTQRQLGADVTVRCASVAPAGDALAVAQTDGALIILGKGVQGDFRRRRLLCRPPGPTRRIAFSPDGKQIAVLGGTTVSLVDRLRGTLLHVWPCSVESSPGPIVFSSDSTLLMCHVDEHAAGIWNTATGELVATLGLDDARLVGGFLSSHPPAIVLAGSDHTLHRWDLSTLQRVARCRLEEPGESQFPVVFSHDGSRVALLSGLRTIAIHACDSGRCIARLAEHRHPVTGFKFGTDGRLASCDLAGEVRVWNGQSNLATVGGWQFGANRRRKVRLAR